MRARTLARRRRCRCCGSPLLRSRQHSSSVSLTLKSLRAPFLRARAEALREHFHGFGTITDAVVMRDRATGKPRGFGFVSFSTAEAADAALAQRHTVCGRVVDAKRCVPREEMRDKPLPPASSVPMPRKLFVAGLALTTKDDAFRTYFEQFGTVVESSVVADHGTGASRGFGFVTFATDAAAEAVLAPDAEHTLEGQTPSVMSRFERGRRARAPYSPKQRTQVWVPATHREPT